MSSSLFMYPATIGMLEIIFMVLVCVLSAMAGTGISRRSGRARDFAAVLLVAPVVFVALAVHVKFFATLSFLSFLTAGRAEYLVLSVTIPMLIFVLYPHAKHIATRIVMICVLMIGVVQFSVMPFLSQAMVSQRLCSMPTRMHEGICLQGTDFTCGPASAVTALRKMGVNAYEGHLAMVACSTPMMGTPEDQLNSAINKCYARAGVESKLRYFDSVGQLKGCPLTVVPIKLGFRKGHYLTVLDVTDDHVIVADPSAGMVTMTHDVFAEQWTYAGIVFGRPECSL